MKKTGTKLLAVFAALALMAAVLTPTVCALGFNSLSDLLGEDVMDILDQWLASEGRSGMSLGDIFSNPNGILDALRERLADMNITVSNSDLASAIVSMLRGTDTSDLQELLNSNDFVNMLAEYLKENDIGEFGITEPTTAPDERQTTDNRQGGNNQQGGNDYSYVDPDSDYDYYYDSYEGYTYTNVYNYYQNGSTAYSTTTAAATGTSTTAAAGATYTYEGAQAYTQTTVPQSSSEPSYSYAQQGVAYNDPMSTVGFSPVYTDDASTKSGSSGLKIAMGAALILLSAGAIVAVVIVLKKTKA